MSMRKTRKFTLMLTAALVITASGARAAKNDSMDTDPGVRPPAMGGAFVAVADDINAIYYNPAGLALLTKRQVAVTHSDSFSLGIDNNYLAYAQQKFGVAWLHTGVPSDFLLGGGDYSEDTFILAGAHQMDPQTSVGLSFKMLKKQYTAPGSVLAGSSAESLSGEGYSFDVGVLYKVDEMTMVGAKVKDLMGSQKTVNTARTATEDKFKPQLSLGFSRRTSKDFMFAIELEGVGKETIVHVGAEKKLQDQLTLRAGLDDDVLTAGLGFSQNDWQFDYSYKNSISIGLDKTQRFGASVKF